MLISKYLIGISEELTGKFLNEMKVYLNLQFRKNINNFKFIMVLNYAVKK